MSSTTPRWVFLDRDGTINAKPTEGEYLTTPAQVRLLPEAASAIRRLNEVGSWVGIVTNQRGIALGRMSLDDLDVVHERLLAQLASARARVDSVYACPHEHGTCSCRKPLPGMLLRAGRELGGIDFARAAVVGDSLSDVQAGNSVGACTVLLRSEAAGAARGLDTSRLPTGGVERSSVAPAALGTATMPHHVSRSLAEAVDWLLE